MYLPEIYDMFSEEYPDIMVKFQQLGVVCRASGPLEEKVQNLIKLGIAIGANSQGAVRSHTRKSLDSGATPQEIIQTVILSLTTTGFPNMIAAMGWVKMVLDKELGR